MNNDSPATRRRVIKYTGAAVLGAVAGCMGAPSAENTETNTETESGQGGTETHGQSTDTGNNHGGQFDSPTEHADVEMVTENDEHHFEPHAVWVKKGGTVKWTLASGTHSTTAYHSDNGKPNRVPKGTKAWDSDVLSEKGATFERTFDQEGVYDYFCRPHETRGMVGTVLVGNPNPENQPGLAPPQDDLPEEAQTAIKELNRKVSDALENN